jgi:hypothetical protein
MINWIENYESNGTQTFASIANATTINTNGFAAKFLECIAENRAFVRCVRNFLNIHIVGSDEIDSSKDKAPVEVVNSSLIKDISPQGILKEKAGVDFDSFKGLLREWYKTNAYTNDPEIIKKWEDYKDVPAKECRKIFKLL